MGKDQAAMLHALEVSSSTLGQWRAQATPRSDGRRRDEVRGRAEDLLSHQGDVDTLSEAAKKKYKRVLDVLAK